ncbi:MAG: general secretion pathway protein GspD [Nitrosomonas sp.]|nr:general secretion pathway protein GspD [Nitrosomonas sp.]
MRFKKYIVMVIMSFVLAGCAINNKTFLTRSEAFEDGQELLLRGELVLGLQKLEQAAQEQPENKEIQMVLSRQRNAVPTQMIVNARNVRLSGDLETAEEMYRYILEHFPGHERAQAGLEALELERRHIASLDYAQELLTLNDVIGAEKTVRTVLQENPAQPYARQLIKQIGALVARSENTGLTLETAFKKPFTIEFRDTDLKTVFEIMAETAGINFVFDKDIRQEAKMSIFVRDNSVEDILNLILMTNQLAYKALNDNSLLIYPNTPAKRKEYEELIVRSFPIAYTDVKQMVAMVRGLVKAKDIYVNEQLNLFIMRDTLEAIRVVERLVALNDMPEPEVMLEVVILTVSRNNTFDLGPNIPTSVTFSSVLDAATGIPLTAAQPLSQFGFDGLKNFSMSSNAAINFSHILSNGDILANPRIRVKNREAAKIHIGTRFPVFSASVSGVNSVVTSTPTYLDLGIKLDVEPIIGLHDDVTMKVTLEVSQKGDDIPAPSTGGGGSGGSAPVITTSNAETLMTLKDGETQVLAGLIENEETRGISGLAGLINIPGFDRLTSGQKIARKKREIILLITPRVVRNITQPSNFDKELHFGTANMPGKLPVTINETAASSLAMASAGTGRGASPRSNASASLSPSNNGLTATPNPFARNTATSPTITLQAPSNVSLDKEFSIRVGLVGATASLTSEAELSYDSSTLAIVDAEENSGTYPLKLGKDGTSGRTAQIRFKVIAANPGTTDITIQNSTAEDGDTGESVEVSLPTTSTINIQ